ncbi:MAG: ABC transporter substrate-binding protein [Longimicrobiales bacterium]|nr:ABC transporter substrate-binding protein [Longimicrobiales bacterium]
MVVQPGSISDAGEEEAARLLRSAEASFEARRFFEALRATDEILQRFPAARVSGEALRLAARAHLEVGDAEEALAAADRYVALLPPGDPRAAGIRVVQARALQGRPGERLDRLLRIERGATSEVREEAMPLLRAALDSVPPERGVDEIRAAPATAALLPEAQARLSVRLFEEGRDGDAETYARAALDAGVGGLEEEWARGVLRGELPAGRRVTEFSIGAVLPTGGPPALAEYARQVAEGIEVAVSTVLGDEFTVSTVIRDDEGDPALGAEIVRELEDRDSVVAIVGFLLDDVLLSAGQAMSTGKPLISPTARTVGAAGEAVYSLEGPDPASAEALADYGAARAFHRVAMLYPASASSRAEAEAFAARAASHGMEVVGRFEYDPGSTFFEPQILGARDALRAEELRSLRLSEDDTLHAEMLEPVGLFMPIPPEDVQLVAPQVIHFGLDTLAVELLGTSGWTDPQTLAEVDTRLTDGVIATAPLGADLEDEGPRRFREAYEEHFRRSLVSQAPAVGYDATLLLLEALRAGRVEPAPLRSAMESLGEVHGATGIFTVRDGRIVRKTVMVRIEDGGFEPVELPLPIGPGPVR